MVVPLSLVAVVWTLLLAPGPNGTVNVVLGAITFGAGGRRLGGR